jgi:preprotein translocase subunit SecG
MQTILTVLHLFLAIGLVGLILMQHGRGADAGAAFGSGASATVFGARGSGSFLSRTTAILATIFFLTSMTLAYFAAQVGEPRGLMEDAEVPAAALGLEVPEEARVPPTPEERVPTEVPAPEAGRGDVPLPSGGDVPVPGSAQ